jgi:S1-C subfamily serine protease
MNKMTYSYQKYEENKRQKYKNNSKILTNRFFIFLTVTIIFSTGLFSGILISYNINSSQINDIFQQVSDLQKKDLESNNDVKYIFYNQSLTEIYEYAKDSIVTIKGLIPYYSFFNLQYSEVQGSGFIYEFNSEMFVITNNHVVDNSINLTVTFSNGNTYNALIVGSDAYSDLAILSVQAPIREFQPIEIVSSSNLRVGDPVIAIGSPFDLSGTLTSGIISQLGRTIDESLAGNFLIANIIQTSVPINPGNSGGPLLNYQGEVIGITTAIIADSNGLGFAIPSNTILREIDSLVRTGFYDQHPWLGVSGYDMTYSIAEAMNINITYGWIIAQIIDDGAADKAGLRGGNKQVRINEDMKIIFGDIIIAIDETRIINGDTLMSYLEEYTSPNQIIKVTILRDKKIIDIELELGKRPL